MIVTVVDNEVNALTMPVRRVELNVQLFDYTRGTPMQFAHSALTAVGLRLARSAGIACAYDSHMMAAHNRYCSVQTEYLIERLSMSHMSDTAVH